MYSGINKSDTSKIRYLGIILKGTYEKSWRASWGEKVRYFKDKLNVWGTLPLDFTQRVQVLNWHLLSHVLYLLQGFWNKLNREEIRGITKIMREFIWDKKTPRVAWNKLLNQRCWGGLGIPDIQAYLRASQLYKWQLLINSNYKVIWKAMVMELPNTSDQLPWHQMGLRREGDGNPSPLISKIGQQIEEMRNKPPWSRWTQDLLPVLNILGSAQDSDRQQWEWASWNPKLIYVSQMAEEGGLLKWEQIKEQYDLPEELRVLYGVLFDCIQESNCIGTSGKQIPQLITWIRTRRELQDIPNTSVAGIQRMIKVDTCDKHRELTEVWQDRLQIQIDEDRWEQTWTSVNAVVKNRAMREFAWKCTHRFFYTPARLAKMLPAVSQDCWRCTGRAQGSWDHIFWDCPELTYLKTLVEKLIRTILQDRLTFDEEICVLGPKKGERLSKAQRNLIIVISLVYKKVITRNWKKPSSIEPKDLIEVIENLKTREIQ